MMKINNSSKSMGLFTAFLTLAICLGSTFTGAYAQASPPAAQGPVKSDEKGSSSYQVGTSILFGQYNNQAIKWNVLSVNSKNQALLFAADVLPNTSLPFDKSSNFWETSFIRAWLNGTQKGEFLSESNFTQGDRDAIIQTRISSGMTGNATDDKIFLISKEEYKQYNVGDVLNDVNSYWSRTGEAGTMGMDYPGNVALFSSDHQFSGSFDASEGGGIRPMMWVDLGALPKDSNRMNQTDTANHNNMNQTDTAKQDSASAENYGNNDTISVNIQRTDNLISARHGRKYQVYGPFNGTKGDSVSCTLYNDTESRLEMMVSGQGKATEDVEMSNTIAQGNSLTATLSIDTLNKDRQFYVFIGSDNISNLTGILSLPGQQSSASK